MLKKNGRNLARNLARSLARNLARNVGFGKQHLAVIFAALNLLTFAFHAALDGPEGLEYQVRSAISTRKAFFFCLQISTGYCLFPNRLALFVVLTCSEALPG